MAGLKFNNKPSIRNLSNYKSSGSGEGSGGTAIIAIIMFSLWGLVELLTWVKAKMQPMFDFFEKYSMFDILTVVGICVVGTWIMCRLLYKMVMKNES